MTTINQRTFEYDGQVWLVLSQDGRSYLYKQNALDTYDRVRVGEPVHPRILAAFNGLFNTLYLYSDADNLWHVAQSTPCQTVPGTR